MSSVLQYVGILLLILVSAFFSATEIAYVGVNKLRLKTLVEEKPTLSGKLALKITENFDDYLGAVLIGNNLANVASSSLATVIVISMLGEDFAWVATVVMTLLVLTFGEIIPKVLAKQFATNYAAAVAIPLYIFSIIIKPVIALVMLIVKLASKLWSGNESNPEAVSEEDFESIIDIVEDEGVLDEEQCDLLQSALDFNDVMAYEIITPRVDIEAIDILDSYEKNIKIIMNSTYSRIPVYEDTPDKIIGILHMNHVYKQLIDNNKVNLRKLLLPVTFVYKTMSLTDVLEKMKENKCHMVIVLDEYGGTLGLLTMEDVLEQLVGEIWDETDDIEKEFICIDQNHFESVGEMRIYDFFDEFDIDIEDFEDFEDDNITIGGWVIDMLEGDYKVGDSFDFENLTITITEIDNMRVERIAIEEHPVNIKTEDA